MHDWFVRATMDTFLFVCLGGWALGSLARKHPKAAGLAARGAFRFFTSFLR